MSILPSVYNDEHPLNAYMRRGVVVLLLFVIVLVVFAQQFTRGFFSHTLEKPLEEQRASEALGDHALSPFALECRALVKLHELNRRAGVWDKDDGDEDAHEENTELKEAKAQLDKSLASLARIAVSRTDRLRLAVVEGEIRGPERALELIQAVWHEADPGGALAADAQTLRKVYAPSPGEQIDAPERDRLIQRHGWFAWLALSFDKSSADPERIFVFSGIRALVAIDLIWSLLIPVFFIVGIVLLGVVLRRATTFESQIDKSDAPGHVYAEMFLVGEIIFLIYVFMNLLLIDQHQALSTIVQEGLLWSMSSAFIWPRLRGVSLETMKSDLGLHRGEGFGREIVYGVGGWLISIPVTFLVGLLLAVFMPENETSAIGIPMFEHPGPGGWLAFALGALSSVVWAPFTEETLFRGAMHRYLPTAMGVAGRVAVTSVIFGLTHPYETQGIIQVAFAGVVFGLLREWRGSLIAPMMAHFLHNATIEAVNLGTVTALF